MAEHILPSGTVACLFTDFEGSTKGWQAHGAAMGRAIARHDALLRAAIASYRGHVFKTVGAAFCASFDRTDAAVEAALAAQPALRRAAGAALDPIRVRPAIHDGTADGRA